MKFQYMKFPQKKTGKFLIINLFFIIIILINNSQCESFMLDLPSSFNPVGSGARAIGMGGSFIAIADDATAASWNPGGLIQLVKPELSVVSASFHRIEDNSFQYSDHNSRDQTVSNSNINYLSFSYPFSLLNRNMIISMNYQHLYDLSREWDLSESAINLSHEQDGKLGAYGLAYCVRIIKNIYFGFTINFWKDGIGQNGWKVKEILVIRGRPSTSLVEYNMNGINANFGMLWKYKQKLTFGAVLKLPFNALLNKQFINIIENGVNKNSKIYKETLEFPTSYGLGIGYKLSDNFYLSTDFYRTNWHHFVHVDSKGIENSPLTGESIKVSNIKPTLHIRLGMEYLIVNTNKHIAIPIRAGLFYAPEPAKDRPDDFWGISLGTGITINNHCFDIAYKLVLGNNVREYMISEYNFNQDVEEHTIYTSYIFHF